MLTGIMRSAAPLSATIVLSAVFISWLVGATDTYRAIWAILGVDDFRFPFLDMHNVLASMQCHRQGIDVFLSNRCDVLDRPHDYSPAWLWFGDWFPFDTTWTLAAGLILCGLFLVSLFCLPRPRGWGGCLVQTAVTTSWAVCFAVERGNNDVLVFVLLVGAARMLAGQRGIRIFAYVVIMAAALLKLYPVIAIGTAVAQERWRAALIVVGTSALAGLVFVWAAYSDLLRVLPNIPGFGTFYWDAFGAKELAAGLDRRFSIGSTVGLVLGLLIGTWSLVFAFRQSRTGEMERCLSTLTIVESTLLVTGALVVCGCFYTGVSAYYRAIHLLLVMPGLIVAASEARGPLRECLLAALASSVCVVWYGLGVEQINAVGKLLQADAGVLQTAQLALWIIEQGAWWWLATMLLSIVLARFVRSGVMNALRDRLGIGPRGASPHVLFMSTGTR